MSPFKKTVPAPISRRHTPSKSNSASGAALVEFALALPIFIVLIFGVIEFGLVMHAKGIITQASREGARYGVTYSLTPKTAADIQNYVSAYLTSVGFSGATVTVTLGDPLSVKITYPYSFMVLPDFVTGFAGDMTLNSETTMRME
jgi:Flp pilus assembly protein TadG